MYGFSDKRYVGEKSTTPAPAASGRKSPDPFKRFRRLSSSNSLTKSTDTLSDSSSTNTPSTSSTVSANPRSPLPPKPSSSSKPTFPPLRHNQSISVSSLSSALGFRSKSTDLSATQDSGRKLRHRKSSSFSTTAGSSESLPGPAAQAMSVPSSPGYQQAIQTDQSSPGLSKQHRQAWYQAQQKTVDLENKPETVRLRSNDTLFPLNVQTAIRSPTQSSQPEIETFLSEDEMMAAGIHIIRRQSDLDKLTSKPATTTAVSSDSDKTQQPEFLEVVDSPAASRQPSPILGQLGFPAARSTSQNDSISSGSSPGATTSNRSFYSSDQLPDGRTGKCSNTGIASQQFYLNPAPSASASPFLNRHTASVGRASGVSATARVDLVPHQTSSFSQSSADGAVTVSRSSDARPPKPPKPSTNLLSNLPRQALSQSESVSPLSTSDNIPGKESSTWSDAPAPSPAPSSRVISGSNESHPMSSPSHSQDRSYHLGAATTTSEGAPPPPPRRPHQHQSRMSASSLYTPQQSTPMSRAASAGGVVGALGQVGQMGAAMGRRGWGFMKTLQASHAPAMSRGHSSSSKMSNSSPGYRNNTESPFSSATGVNPATREWLAYLQRPSSHVGADPIFGTPLEQAVLVSRLANLASPFVAPNVNQLGLPDLGEDFGANFAESSRVIPRMSISDNQREPCSRQEARSFYLPRLVVRCIESLEVWGSSEEGIYRISGRSSHTNKLRTLFSNPKEDIKLDDISPADLDINSVCSVLKGYLRELPEAIIPQNLANQLDTIVSKLLAAESQRNNAGDKGVRSAVAANQKAAHLDPVQVETQVAPLVSQLPVYNWYLLRELSEHLGQLSQPAVVAQTKMPLSNLTLVLAPTVSISVPVLQILVQQRQAIFKCPAPSEEALAFDSPASRASKRAEHVPPDGSIERAQRSGSNGGEADFAQRAKLEKAPKPEKLEKWAGVSRVPVMARRRASSMSLSGLLNKSADSKSDLSSPDRPQPNVDEQKIHHSRTFSSSSSAMLSRLPSAADRHISPSPSFVQEPYERPSTSLGHFNGSHAASRSSGSPRRDFESRDAARRYYALALDDVDTFTKPSPQRSDSKDVSTPIAQYYEQFRQDTTAQSPTLLRTGEAFLEPQTRGAAVSLALVSPSSPTKLSADESPVLDNISSMHRYWAEKIAMADSSPTEQKGEAGGSSAVSALDRPRPPTSSSAGFFSGKSRRQDSRTELASSKAPLGSSGVQHTTSRSRESSSGDAGPAFGPTSTSLTPIAPLKIVKRNVTMLRPGSATEADKTLRVQKSSDLSSSASSNTMSSAASTIDTFQSHHSYVVDDKV